MLHVDGDFRATFLAAAEAVDAIPDTVPNGRRWATGTTAGWTIAIRYDGTLIHVEKNAQGRFIWQQYKLGNLVTPTRLARDRDVATRARVSNGPLGQHFPAAIEAMTATGFDLASDPPSQCP